MPPIRNELDFKFVCISRFPSWDDSKVLWNYVEIMSFSEKMKKFNHEPKAKDLKLSVLSVLSLGPAVKFHEL
jgi:hypothetical protein